MVRVIFWGGRGGGVRHRKLVEINFLCVHKKLRAKRLAPVLIREITRRVHVQNIFQATYTAGLRLPRPVTSCRYGAARPRPLLSSAHSRLISARSRKLPLSRSRYFHRSLNPKKLIETGFSYLPRGSTMASMIKNYRLPDVRA